MESLKLIQSLLLSRGSKPIGQISSILPTAYRLLQTSLLGNSGVSLDNATPFVIMVIRQCIIGIHPGDVREGESIFRAPLYFVKYYFLFFCLELIEELVRATDLKFGREIGNTVSRNKF